MKYNEINNPVKERGMPSSIIKHKQKLAMMTDKELADRFKDADEDKLRRMAWGHGYGKMSSHYWDRVQNARTTGGFREDPQSVHDILQKHPKEVNAFQTDPDFDILDHEEFYEELFNYFVNQGEMPYGTAKAKTGDPAQWITDKLHMELTRPERQRRVVTDPETGKPKWENNMEGFIGKKIEYNDFLQNKLDQAIQEYDTPEKKAERDALMQKYLNKGGSVEKVPAGQTAYKGKELKPAFKKNPGTPHTSPMSDESVEEQNIYINGMTTRKDVIQNILDNIDNGNVDSAVDDLTQYLEIAEKDDAGISEQDVPKDHEYGPSSDKAPAGKRGYQSSPGARTAHLKTVKTLAKKRRRQMDKTATTETSPAPENKKQNYSDKEVRQAKGIAFDKRYKGGNYTGASNTIDKLKKGLSSHPDVADALRRANEDTYAPARLIGAAEASLTYGLQMAQHVINKDYGIAERNARVIAENWPPLIDKIKNVYKTNERVENGVIMCPEACCGKAVTECKCGPMCEHCNCFIIKAQENKSESQDGLQPADLKRLGATEPKIYVHKNGKTIMIPKRKHNEYIAKGWKQSALRAETSYESKLTDMLNQRLK